MRKYLSFLLIWICVLPAFTAERKKVGLVLGGGGAKGVSHIGVLKVLEEADIPIDYIAGTSMGAIVGGLYAVGYNATTIDSMIRELDWTMLLSDRVKRSSRSFPEKENSERYILSLPFGKEKKDRVVGGVIKGQNLLNLFSNLTIGYHDSVDFNSFHIPFACVALNAVDGSDYVFRKGSLPLAMRASMAIPAAFTPVRIDSMILIDGGVSNNYPADVALNMGADILIGVDLGTSDLKTLEKLNTPGDVIGQLLALYGHEKYSRNKDTTNLLIRPNVVPYHAASFTQAAIDTLINRGELAARQHWDEIVALKEFIGITDTTQTFVEQNLSYPAIEKERVFIRNIFFEGADPRDESWLRRICKLKENRLTSVHELEEVISILIGTNAYSNVSYKLIGEEQQDLVLIVQEKAISSLNAGLRFDTEEIVAVLLNATLTYRSAYRSKLALTGRIGKQSYARLDYAIERTPLRNFNLSYKFAYNDLNFYNQGKKIVNSTYRHHFAEFGYSDMNWLNFKFNIGLRYEYYDYDSFLYNEGDHDYSVKPEGFVNYFVNVHLETFDRGYFPEKGVSLQANYTVYTDNFVSYKDHTPFSALGMGFTSVVRLNSHLSLLPSLDGRFLIGRDPAYPYLNAVGGEVYHKYLPQQLPFAGINNVEIFDNSAVLARVNLRQRIAGRHYLSLIGNYGVHNKSFFDLFDGEHVWGVSLGYAYNSVAGPLSVSLGNSNRNDNTQFYLNLGYNF